MLWIFEFGAREVWRRFWGEMEKSDRPTGGRLGEAGGLLVRRDWL